MEITSSLLCFFLPVVHNLSNMNDRRRLALRARWNLLLHFDISPPSLLWRYQLLTSTVLFILQPSIRCQTKCQTDSALLREAIVCFLKDV